MKKTVFFGPFVGELGWEFLHWQGWVRKMCRGPYRDYKKIVCSFPGRQPFYQLADEFWPLPQSFLDLKTSGHSYITDGWRNGYPGIQHGMRKETNQQSGESQFVFREDPLPGPSIGDVCEAMLAQFKAHLPPDTRFFVPWQLIHCDEGNFDFGTKLGPGEKIVSRAPIFHPVSFDRQHLEYLTPSAQAAQILAQNVPEPRKFVCVFPRERLVRRPDKNWTKENYAALVRKFQAQWPDVLIAICGEPGGAYFSDGVPAGCLDLINVPVELRLDLQIAALRRSVLAVGAVSGALCIALGANCPSLVFCFDYYVEGWKKANALNTPLVLYPEMNPPVDVIFSLADGMRQMIDPNRPAAPATVPASAPAPRVEILNRQDGGPAFEKLYTRIHDAILEGVDAKTVPSCEIAFADPDICWLLYSSIRRKRARSVVETGSFMGMSTLVSATALAENARDYGVYGKLYAISLDSFYRVENPMSHAARCAERLGLSPFIHFLEGSSIPLISMESADAHTARDREAYLKRLALEGRESLLPRLAGLLGKIDIAYLDSLHYEGVQMAEIASVLEHLAADGEIIVDDVNFPDYPHAWIVKAFSMTNLARLSLFSSQGKQLRVMKLEKNPDYTSHYKKFASWWWGETLEQFLARFRLSPRGPSDPSSRPQTAQTLNR